jgi:phage head maturation protease
VELDGPALNGSGDWFLPSIDHCHDTGSVRGILHRRCNLAAEGSSHPTVRSATSPSSTEWTEIDSMWEGRFMERFAPARSRRRFNESRDKLRVLFQHGRTRDR